MGRLKSTGAAAVAMVLAFGVIAGTAGAAPEDLDPRFGDGGVRVLAAADSYARKVLATRDHRIYVVVDSEAYCYAPDCESFASVGIWRLLEGGNADAAFGRAGFVQASTLCTEPCRVTDLAVAGDRIYVVAGPVLHGLRSDGSRDSAYGNGGRARLPEGSVAQNLVLNEWDGSLAVSGKSAAGEGAIWRIRDDGSLDDGFGQLGTALVGFSGAPQGLASDAEQRLYVMGGGSVVRMLADGRRDGAFAPGPIPASGSIAVARDGRIFGAGSRQGPNSGEPALEMVVWALAADGAVDATFGDGGIARIATGIPEEDGVAESLFVDAESRIVVTGLVGRMSYIPFDLEPRRAIVTRVLPDGSPDVHFAPDGWATFRFGHGSEGRGIAPDWDGRILVAGTAHATPSWSGKYPVPHPRAAVFRLQGGETTYARPYPEAVAVEYFHQQYGHYFVSAGVDETRRLDTDVAWTSQWSRTGHTFNVWMVPDGDHFPVCRFWSGQSFAPKSSHFYTPFAGECATVGLDPVWQFEGNAFAWKLPIWGLLGASCPADARPLYRAYNRGASGAPNHRYTTDPAILDEMIGQGWEMEGDRWTRIFACVPRHD
jgi:uncharacterized delta-60 repeat protein